MTVMGKLLFSLLLGLVVPAIAVADDPPYAFHSSVPPAEYKMEVRVLPEEHRMEISGMVTVAGSPKSRDYLEFELSELMPELQAEVVAPNPLIRGAWQGKRVLGEDFEPIGWF
jgi:hypothetical protein